MRRSLKIISLTPVFAFVTLVAVGQTQLFTSDAYTIELPSPLWRVLSGPDATHEHAEIVFGDNKLDGFLQVRREVVDAGTTAASLARRDIEQRLPYQPGFVEGKQETFVGRLSGVTVSYEFVKTGKPMLGRIYYLQADNRTIYSLRFTGLRDKLMRIRNQTDSIARSFQLK